MSEFIQSSILHLNINIFVIELF